MQLQLIKEDNFYYTINESGRMVHSATELNQPTCETVYNNFLGIINVEELAAKEAELAKAMDDVPYENGVLYGYIKGFTTAQEMGRERKFNREQLIEAMIYGVKKGLAIGKIDETDCDWVNNYVDSLNTPKAVFVDIVMEQENNIPNTHYATETKFKPLLTNGLLTIKLIN